MGHTRVKCSVSSWELRPHLQFYTGEREREGHVEGRMERERGREGGIEGYKFTMVTVS